MVRQGPPTQPLSMQQLSRAVFEQLFGVTRNGRSILDGMDSKARRLKKPLGAAGRARVTEYLDEVIPEESFTPESPVERARMRALMHFADEMPAASVRVPTYNLAFLPRFQKMSREEFVELAESKPLRREFMLTMGQTGFPKAEMDAALGRLRRTYERMQAEIEKSGGPWLLGRRITLADVAIMPALVRMDDLGMSDAWQDLPRVVAWFEAIRAQPAFAPTYYPGSLVSERFPHLREAKAKSA